MGEVTDFCRRLAGTLCRELDAPVPEGRILLPSRGIYRSIFAWDSGWHYHWLRYLDEERALDELTGLFATQYGSGKIPHETPLAGQGEYPLSRRIVLSLLRNGFDERGNSCFIDPPVYLVAALDAVESDLPRAMKEGFMSDVDAKLSWIRGMRMPSWMPSPWNRLPVILHPLESGTDFSPSFDEVWGRPPLLQARSLTLLKRIKKYGWSLSQDEPPDFPLVYDLTFVTFYLQALRRRDPGSPESGDLLGEFFDATFDRDSLLFRQYWLLRDVRYRTETTTFSSMLPCILYDSGEESLWCRRAVERHLLPGGTFWKGVLPSFNPERRSRSSPFLWRGSCSWMNMNYMHFRLLRRHGFHGAACDLFQRLEHCLGLRGPWEYFDAFRLRGGGASCFSWNGLILAMERELLSAR
ncbi:MAG: hypothetical protein JXA20_03775 [Spirochaetes bacterium]|nr:hypothetical protein [Spirochaetota bacterium]